MAIDWTGWPGGSANQNQGLGFGNFVQQYNPYTQQLHPQQTPAQQQQGAAPSDNWWGGGAPDPIQQQLASGGTNQYSWSPQSAPPATWGGGALWNSSSGPVSIAGQPGMGAAPVPTGTQSGYAPGKDAPSQGGYASAPGQTSGAAAGAGIPSQPAPQSWPAAPQPGWSTPGAPGMQNGSYFANDPNNPQTTISRAMYDLNNPLAFQHVIDAQGTNPNAPQYQWDHQQYQRYYNDYVNQNANNPNLTFTQYMDNGNGQRLNQEYQNAPASARGVTNAWQLPGRYTS